MGFFGDLFGKRDKSMSEGYSGLRPYASLKEIPEGLISSEELQKRLGGFNVGYRPEILSNITAPYAVSRRASVSEYEIPKIRQGLSARGLNRSTMGVAQEELAQQQAERDIEERVAQVNLENEKVRRTEIDQALTDLQTFTINEANQRTTRANFDYGEDMRARGAAQQEKAAANAGMGRLATLATTAIGAAIGGSGGAMIGSQLGGQIFGSSGYSQMNSQDMGAMLQALGGQPATTANIAGRGNVNVAPANYYRSAAARPLVGSSM